MSHTGEINLIPYDVIMREKTQGRIWMWAVIILLVIFLLLGGYLLEKRKIGTVEGVIADLSVKKLEIEEKIKQLGILQDKRNRLASKERVIKTLLHKRSLSLLFSELEKGMNNNVWLTSFNFKDDFSLIKNGAKGENSDQWVETGYFIVKDRTGNRKNAPEESPGVSTSLHGIANSNKDLADFLKQLSTYDIFSEVNLKYSKEATYREMNGVEFEIETYLDKF
jgi:Tfp pilus assembly protein PilN